MRTTFQGISAAELAATETAYAERGWTVSQTANGISLIADDAVCGIEVTGELALDVRRYLDANDLTGPIIDIPGAERHEIHLVTAPAKARLALDALAAMGATAHVDGAGIPLPPTKLYAGSARWSVTPTEARWVPPVVALAAAVRAVTTRTSAATRAAS